MNYDAWKGTVPEAIKADSLWKMTAYRLALFLADLGWHDVTRLKADQRTRGLSDQLYRAIGSISANLSEGHSRGTGKDRARFYEYALGSARESRDWYFKARHILGDTVADHRLEVPTEVIRLLLTMVPQQRGRGLRGEGAQYLVHRDDAQPGISIGEKLDDLLRHIPLPDP
jgi:four helix bundle protein